VGDPWDEEFQLANSIALLSYLIHVHNHPRPVKQGLVHVGLITWEGCHRFGHGGGLTPSGITVKVRTCEERKRFRFGSH
jgi:hypothetical protein